MLRKTHNSDTHFGLHFNYVLFNFNQSKMTVVCQIHKRVVFILEKCLYFQFFSNSIQLEIEIKTEEKYVEELCRIYAIG